MSWERAGVDRACEAGGDAGGGVADGISDDFDWGEFRASDVDVFAQSDGDGYRGDDSAQPMDSVVVLGGCDKTLPAQVMAVASTDIPTVVVQTGPMVVGHHKGEVLGACTDCRRLWGQHRAGTVDAAEIELISGRLCPSVGTCMVMGTASTMACIIEAMGLALPMSAAAPATHADRRRIAEASGKRAAEIAISAAPRPSDLITEASVRNAMIVLQAIGGSTNGLIHLIAMAGRAGVKVDLEAFDRLGREIPVLLNLKPSGEHYMEHFHHAGGLPALMRELSACLDLSAPTIGGGTIGDVIAKAEKVPGQDVIRSISAPLKKEGAMAILYGNLVPGDAVIKHSAASAKLMRHKGRAVVFDSVEDMTARIDSLDLDVNPDDILVLRNAGPRGAGHAGGGIFADSHETGAAGSEGYGAYFGCTDERDGVRHHCVAHHAGSSGRGAAGGG